MPALISRGSPQDFPFRLCVPSSKLFCSSVEELLARGKHEVASCALFYLCKAFALLVGPSGLEPPTSCLSGTRSNLLSYDPMWLVWFSHLDFSESGNGFIRSLLCVGVELSSRAASSKVFSPLQSLTSVFGMGTGGPSAFVTPTR